MCMSEDSLRSLLKPEAEASEGINWLNCLQELVAVPVVPDVR